MPTLLFLLGCLPPILWDTARSLDSGGTGETGADTDTGAETGGETANETGETGDTDGEPCGGQDSCDVSIEGVMVKTADLSTVPGLTVVPLGDGRVDVAFANLAQGTSGVAHVTGQVTVASRRVDLDVELTPNGAPDFALTAAFWVNDLSPGEWTIAGEGFESVTNVQ